MQQGEHGHCGRRRWGGVAPPHWKIIRASWFYGVMVLWLRVSNPESMKMVCAGAGNAPTQGGWPCSNALGNDSLLRREVFGMLFFKGDARMPRRGPVWGYGAHQLCGAQAAPCSPQPHVVISRLIPTLTTPPGRRTVEAALKSSITGPNGGAQHAQHACARHCCRLSMRST
jgi:hypothetical protein